MLYIIDFENVSTKGLEGIDNLGAADEVVILYTKATASAAETFMCAKTYKCVVKGYKVTTGYKDALDFKLLIYLFSRYAQGCSTVAIISKDKGFLSLRDAILELSIPWEITLCYGVSLKDIHTIFKFTDKQCQHLARVGCDVYRLKGSGLTKVNSVSDFVIKKIYSRDDPSLVGQRKITDGCKAEELLGINEVEKSK